MGLTGTGHIKGIGAIPAHKLVITGTSHNRIIARTGIDHVISGTAINHVIACQPGKAVGAVIAGQGIVARRAADIFNPGKLISAGRPR